MNTTQSTSKPENELPEEFFQIIFSQAGDGIFLIAEDSTILEANQRGCEILGYPKEDLLGQPVLKFQPPDAIGHIRNKLAELTVTKPVTTESVFLRKDGTRVSVEITGKLLSSHQIIGMVRDITERKAAQQALVESEQKYRRLVENSPDGITVVDETGRIIEWNVGQQCLSGVNESAALGNYIWDVQFQLIPEEQRSEAYLEQIKQKTLEVLRTGRGLWQKNQLVEEMIQLPDGMIRNVESMNYVYKTALGYRIGSITRDITKRKQVEMLLEYMAMHDALTDLPNRFLFENRLIHALDRAKREPDKKLAVMMLDLDRFKEVNDTFGHAFGDQLLKVVGVRLQTCLRKSDTAARMGGDEFALINESLTSDKDIELIAAKVSQAVSLPIEIEGHVIQLTTSIGISVHTPSKEDAGQLLREADLAMYQAKQARNCYKIYTPPHIG
jgi:diguanylate cyclase (GGDEF)-like protein/PAS domain S-box-containing protein